MKAFGWLGIIVGVMSIAPAHAQEPVRLYAAGSLRNALTEVAQAFTRESGVPVVTTFGASGLLRERIEKGERADVFASADLGHPQALAAAGRAAPVVVFVQNRLCAIAAPGVAMTSQTLLDRMLDPAIRLGTSTPVNDPSGDYTWELFRKADAVKPGAYQALDRKALKLVGGRDSPQPPEGISAYGWFIRDKQADIFLTYCTNAAVAVKEVPGAAQIALPAELAVGAQYGLTVLKAAAPAGQGLASFILSAPAQSILIRHGFAAAGKP